MDIISDLTNSDARKEAIKKVFVSFDENKNGYLDANELYNGLCSIFGSFGDVAPSQEETNEILATYDYNQDEQLNLEEFTNLMEYVILEAIGA